MKIGCKLKCIKLTGWEILGGELGMTLPKVGETYTLRGIYDESDTYPPSYYLEEIVNGPLPMVNVEPSFKAECFVEVEDGIEETELSSYSVNKDGKLCLDKVMQ